MQARLCGVLKICSLEIQVRMMQANSEKYVNRGGDLFIAYDPDWAKKLAKINLSKTALPVRGWTDGGVHAFEAAFRMPCRKRRIVIDASSLKVAAVVITDDRKRDGEQLKEMMGQAIDSSEAWMKLARRQLGGGSEEKIGDHSKDKRLEDRQYWKTTIEYNKRCWLRL